MPVEIYMDAIYLAGAQARSGKQFAQSFQNPEEALGLGTYRWEGEEEEEIICRREEGR